MGIICRDDKMKEQPINRFQTDRHPAFEGFEQATGYDVAGDYLIYIFCWANN
jgi:hypothetical protein